jgi:hypothetical protein
MANNGRSSPLLQLFSRLPSDGTTTDDNTTPGTFMRSLSKCFDPPLDEAIVEGDGIGLPGSPAASNKGGKGEFTTS